MTTAKNVTHNAGEDSSRGWTKRLKSWPPIASVIIFLGLVALSAIFVFQEVRKTIVFVNPVKIPADLLNEGYDSEALAAGIVEELGRVERTVRERAKTDRLMRQFARLDGIEDPDVKRLGWGAVVESKQRDIKLSDKWASLQTIVWLIKSVRNTPDLTVDVSVIRRAMGYNAQVTVAGGWIGTRRQTDTSILSDLESLMQEAARRALWLAAPHTLVSYEIYVEDVNCVRNPSCDYSRPLQLLREIDATASVPVKPWILLASSSVLMRRGELEKVIDLTGKAVALEPKFVPAYFNWVNALLGLKQYEEAVRVAKQWIEIKPRDPEAYEYLGSALEQMHDFDAASQAYKTSLEIDSTRPVVYVLWGNLLDGQRKYDDAAEKYEESPAQPVVRRQVHIVERHCPPKPPNSHFILTCVVQHPAPA